MTIVFLLHVHILDKITDLLLSSKNKFTILYGSLNQILLSIEYLDTLIQNILLVSTRLDDDLIVEGIAALTLSRPNHIFTGAAIPKPYGRVIRLPNFVGSGTLKGIFTINCSEPMIHLRVLSGDTFLIPA